MPQILHFWFWFLSQKLSFSVFTSFHLGVKKKKCLENTLSFFMSLLPMLLVYVVFFCQLCYICCWLDSADTHNLCLTCCYLDYAVCGIIFVAFAVSICLLPYVLNCEHIYAY